MGDTFDDSYELGLSERIDRLEGEATKALWDAQDKACIAESQRNLFFDTKLILSDVERLRAADISFSDALMILTLRELRNRR